MAVATTRTITLNGASRTVTVPDETEQLLYVLRNSLAQRGPKFGCGVSQCGSCTVLVNDQIRRSCVTPLNTVPEGAVIETLDGLGTPDAPHPMQAAFLAEQAGQCAFCVNGMIMGAVGWLRGRVAAGNTTLPTETEIRDFLSGGAPGTDPIIAGPLNYICRCGTHERIVRAIRVAAGEVLP
jgi:nicotinate dehydrogenase subunit A